MGLKEIKGDMDLVNAIDWEMTPEEAVTLYLEWGNNWSHGKMVRSREDRSYYFVVDTWEDPPKICLIRRNSQEAAELAAIDMPESLREGFRAWAGHRKGVYTLNDALKAWLKKELEIPDYPLQ